jgi:hypothetical protein
MKYLGTATFGPAELEVYECDCGFHIGVDASYLDQVCQIYNTACPACGSPINIDERDQESWFEKHGANCYFCGKLFDERDGMPADPFNNNDGGTICPDCLAYKVGVLT